jgi:hypothetical protein
MVGCFERVSRGVYVRGHGWLRVMLLPAPNNIVAERGCCWRLTTLLLTL